MCLRDSISTSPARHPDSVNNSTSPASRLHSVNNSTCPVGHLHSVNSRTLQTVQAVAEAANSSSDEVWFRVGKERAPLLAQKGKLAAVSPVFAAMFNGCWIESGGVVEISDVEPHAMRFLIG